MPFIWTTPRSLRTAVASVAIIVPLAGCGILHLTDTGSTCGGAQSASARAILPDTGIAASTEVLVVLTQFDPFLIGELTDISVQHLWPAARGENPEPDPRVRLVRDDGRILLDTLATRRIPNDGNLSRSTWIVYQRTASADRRNALFDALRDQALWLELWGREATRPGTRIRLRTESATVSPIVVCS